MKVARVIPCLDVKDGRVVKGVNFKGLSDAGDPVQLAREYDRQGADELIVLDISASLENRATMMEMVSAVAEQLYIPLTVGGGVTSLEDARALLRCGADKVAVNSAAIKTPDLLAKIVGEFGSQCCVLAVDAKRTPSGFEVFSHGGSRATGLILQDWVKLAEAEGVGEILLTSMDADGTRNGYDLEMTRLVSETVAVPVVASGGAGSIDDLVTGVTEGKADAVLAASIFHFGEATVAQAKGALLAAGVTVRPA